MANVKQMVSCEKSIRVSILTASMYKIESNWDDKQVETFCFERFNEIKGRFKYHMFMKIANEILSSKQYHKTINAKLNGSNIIVALEYEPLKKYVDSFGELVEPVFEKIEGELKSK